ncbi:indolepyruvate ferredoxin oxidoreductase domain protein [Burkholderia pseudomallei MSHR684]|nr:indolepyruvate ferredoxin oxidoreductase domain protein [Burkholderia pseudomallei MSHR684]
MSAMFDGFTTGMCHAIIAKSLWCGIDDDTQP